MPNWCDNDLRITGEPEEIRRFLKDFKGQPINYDESVKFYGKNTTKERRREILKARKMLRKPQEDIYCFNALFPVPQYLVDMYNCKTTHDTKSKKKRKIAERNKYSFLSVLHNETKPVYYNNCYDWKIMNWGTKWDIDGDIEFSEIEEIDENYSEVQCWFSTAWSPIVELISNIKNKYDLRFELHFFEEGCDFSGHYITQKGKEDDYLCVPALENIEEIREYNDPHYMMCCECEYDLTENENNNPYCPYCEQEDYEEYEENE